MTPEQRRAIDARRTPRPRTAADKDRTEIWRAARQRETLAAASRAGQVWTTQEMAVALDRERTVWDAARALGRSASAVANMRARHARALRNTADAHAD